MKFFLTLFSLLILLGNSVYAELPPATPEVVEQALASGKPTLIDFGLLTCGVCKKMAPHLERVAADYANQANVLFIDVRADQTLAQKFEVRMLPAQIFLDANGNEVHRHTGYLDQDGILSGLKAAGLK